MKDIEEKIKEKIRRFGHYVIGNVDKHLINEYGEYNTTTDPYETKTHMMTTMQLTSILTLSNSTGSGGKLHGDTTSNIAQNRLKFLDAAKYHIITRPWHEAAAKNIWIQAVAGFKSGLRIPFIGAEHFIRLIALPWRHLHRLTNYYSQKHTQTSQFSNFKNGFDEMVEKYGEKKVRLIFKGLHVTQMLVLGPQLQFLGMTATTIKFPGLILDHLINLLLTFQSPKEDILNIIFILVRLFPAAGILIINTLTPAHYMFHPISGILTSLEKDYDPTMITLFDVMAANSIMGITCLLAQKFGKKWCEFEKLLLTDVDDIAYDRPAPRFTSYSSSKYCCS